MKKNNLATKAAEPKLCPQRLMGEHEHVHAANCGHKSYVHNGHVCYEHDQHFHYWHQDHLHECEGPHAKSSSYSGKPTTTPVRNTGRDRFTLVEGAKGKKK